MPDISMCMNDDCDKRHLCYRYTAEPNKWRQAYSDFVAHGCMYFVPNELYCALKEISERQDEDTCSRITPF